MGYFVFDNDVRGDYQKFIADPTFLWLSLGRSFVIAITSVCWFYITKNEGVMVGSIYEIKYIVIMALIYIVFGESKFTWNMAIGVSLALGSIYFISKK